MLPTKIAKPRVLSIQGSESNEKNSSKIAPRDAIKAKSFKIKSPKTVPLRSDKSTFFE